MADRWQAHIDDRAIHEGEAGRQDTGRKHEPLDPTVRYGVCCPRHRSVAWRVGRGVHGRFSAAPYRREVTGNNYPLYKAKRAMACNGS
jgi:hypothetical protein